MPIFQHNLDDSEYDDAYIAMMAKPTNDEVGADIETHGHIPVTQENITQDPFTQKGSLANALDDLLEEQEKQQKHGNIDNRDDDDVDAGDSEEDTAKQLKMPESYTQSQRVDHLPELHEMRTGELTGETEGCNMEDNEKMTGEDEGESAKDALTTVFDEIFTMDGTSENTDEDDEEELIYKDWEKKTQPVPKLPDELSDKDKPDANGLVYITRTFTVDPAKYLSTNYRPIAAPKNNTVQQKTVGGDVVTKEEVTMEEESSPDAKFSAASDDEPTERQEQQAAKEADGELEKSKPEDKNQKQEKGAEDSAPENVVLDYASYIDGSSFCCCDDVNGIDYSKVAMDAGPKKKVTRENCQTTFAQCRAKNPLFCRFHGPKLLEADIKTAIKAVVGAGVFVNVTKDKNAKDKFTFRLTVGCTPAQKPMVEKQIHQFMTMNPGIKSKEDWKDVGTHKQSQEFEMDILKADEPPVKGDKKGQKALIDTKKAIKAKKEMAQVKETSAAIEKKAAQNIKPSNFAPELANEWFHIDQDYITSSLLPEDENFQKGYEEIADAYNKAYDAKDKEGVKKAIKDLKKLVTDFKPEWSIPQGPSDEPPEEGEGEEQNEMPKDGQEAVEKGLQPEPPQGIEPAPTMPPEEASQPKPDQAQETEGVKGQEEQAEQTEETEGQTQEPVQQGQSTQQPVQAQPQQQQTQQEEQQESVPEQGAVEPSQETVPEQGQEKVEVQEEEPKVLKLHKPTGIVPTIEQAEKGEVSNVGTDPQGGTDSDAMSRIEAAYKDYVEEPVPDWVNALNDDDKGKYADLLEAVQKESAEGDGESDKELAYDALVEFEHEHENDSPKTETSQEQKKPEPKKPTVQKKETTADEKKAKLKNFKHGQKCLLKGADTKQQITFLKDNGDGTADIQVKTPGSNMYMPSKVETKTVSADDLMATGIQQFGGASGSVNNVTPDDVTEEMIDSTADAIASKKGYPKDAISEDIQDRLSGKKPVKKAVLDLVKQNAEKGSPIVEAFQKLYDESGWEADGDETFNKLEEISEAAFDVGMGLDANAEDFKDVISSQQEIQKQKGVILEANKAMKDLSDKFGDMAAMKTLKHKLLKDSKAKAMESYYNAIEDGDAAAKKLKERIDGFKVEQTDTWKGEAAKKVEFAVKHGIQVFSKDEDSKGLSPLGQIAKMWGDLNKFKEEQLPDGHDQLDFSDINKAKVNAINAITAFDEVMSGFEDKMNSAKTFEDAKKLNNYAMEVQKAADDMAMAVQGFKDYIGGGKKMIEDMVEVKKKEDAIKKRNEAKYKELNDEWNNLPIGDVVVENADDFGKALNEGDFKKAVEIIEKTKAAQEEADKAASQQTQQQSGSPKKFKTKEEVGAYIDSLSPKEKLQKLIEYFNKKISTNPPNVEEFKGKLSKAQAMLANIV